MLSLPEWLVFKTIFLFYFPHPPPPPQWTCLWTIPQALQTTLHPIIGKVLLKLLMLGGYSIGIIRWMDMDLILQRLPLLLVRWRVSRNVPHVSRLSPLHVPRIPGSQRLQSFDARLRRFLSIYGSWTVHAFIMSYYICSEHHTRLSVVNPLELPNVLNHRRLRLLRIAKWALLVLIPSSLVFPSSLLISLLSWQHIWPLQVSQAWPLDWPLVWRVSQKYR